MGKIYPVIIVGGGPAGSSCAKALIDAGVDVLVLEKMRLPRHKCCSGILFGQAQELLRRYFGKLPPESAYCSPRVIHASNILAWSEEKGPFVYEWELPMAGRSFTTSYLNVWRNKFDFWLLKESGAQIKDGLIFRDFSSSGDKIRVAVQSGVRRTELLCSYLVGADGASSAVRDIFDSSYKKRLNELSTYQAYYTFSDLGNLEKSHWYVFLGLIGGPVATVHKKDDVLTLCVGSFEKKGSLKGLMKRFEDFLSSRFKVKLLEKQRSEGCLINDMNLRGDFCLGGGRVFLVGDAAGFMYLNGEGISVAIDSGYRAGKAIAKGLKGKGEAWDLYRRETEDIREQVKLCASKQTLIGRPEGTT